MTKTSNRTLTEKLLAEHYSKKFNGTVSCLWDTDKKAYCIHGEGLPAHPDLKTQYPNGWSLLDYISPRIASKLAHPETKKTNKRILSVKIKRMVDTDADTSYLGEYSNHATSDYSIDRAHSQDCASVEKETREAKDKLERIAEYIGDLFNENLGKFNGMLGDSPAHRESEVLDEAYELVRSLADEITDCDCGGHCVSSRELPYFNPSFNYITKDDKPADGLTPENVRKYTRQDYERMESLNNGSWCYIGISAEAEVLTNAGSMSTVQTIHSGGLWGIESDSERSHLESVEQEELENLKSELSAIGFSSRAISKAFDPDSIEEVSR